MAYMNIGVPKIPVIMLKGISFGAILLAKVSTTIIIIDPSKTEIGITFLLLLPTNNRTMFGITTKSL